MQGAVIQESSHFEVIEEEEKADALLSPEKLSKTVPRSANFNQ